MVLVYEEEDLGVMTEAEARRRDQRKLFQVKFFNAAIHRFIVQFVALGEPVERRSGIGVGA